MNHYKKILESTTDLKWKPVKLKQLGMEVEGYQIKDAKNHITIGVFINSSPREYYLSSTYKKPSLILLGTTLPDIKREYMKLVNTIEGIPEFPWKDFLKK